MFMAVGLLMAHGHHLHQLKPVISLRQEQEREKKIITINVTMFINLVQKH